MIELAAPFRWAKPNDAQAMAELNNLASYGLALYFWEQIKEPEQEAFAVGRERALRETGSFSYRNCIIAELDGQVAAGLIGYPQPASFEPLDHDAIPPLILPLAELEQLAPDSWYVNVLAAYPGHQGRGLGTQLLQIAERLAMSCGKQELSLIAEDDNVDAIRLYHRFGFKDITSRPIVKEGWLCEGENWILMTKPLGLA